jgi:hypothetical protein
VPEFRFPDDANAKIAAERAPFWGLVIGQWVSLNSQQNRDWPPSLFYPSRGMGILPMSRDTLRRIGGILLISFPA